MPTLRRLEPADHAQVLALNEANVEALAPMDEDRLLELDKIAAVAWEAYLDSRATDSRMALT